MNDKALHFAAGMLIAVIVGLLTTPIAGLLAASLAGIIKETIDATGRGTPEVVDLMATVAGGIIGMAAVSL